MIQFKDIHIPKPCSVDYDSLPYNEVKRFCGSCEKHVYDFRGKDEAYFNSIINTHGKVCGVFYADEIQKNLLQIQRPFYYAFVTKLFGMLLFVKTFFSSHQAYASLPVAYHTVQQSNDSAGVAITFKNRPSQYTVYSLEIFINGVCYKSGANLDNGSGFIWLPDSLKENDEIKISVKQYENENNKIHRRSYNFKFKESKKITIEVNYKKPHKIHLFKRRRRATAGYMYY